MASSTEGEESEQRGGMFGGGSPLTSTLRTETPILDNFSEDFRKIVKQDPIKYYSRHKEVNLLLKFLLKKEKYHTFIVGEIGTGRHTLVKSALQTIDSGNLSIGLKHLSFKALDFTKLVAGTKYRGSFEERFQAISNELQKSKNLVIYFDSLTSFLFDGDTWNYGYTLQTLVANKDVRVVSVLSTEEYLIFQKKFKSLSRHINIINLYPPSKEETLSILQCHVPEYQNEYSCAIDLENLNKIIELSNLYLPDDFQPTKSILVLEEVCMTKSLNIAKYLDKDSELAKLLNVQTEMESRVADISIRKNEVVKAQQYDKAAQLRDEEKELIFKIEEVQKQVQESRQHIFLTISDEEIFNAVSEITGITSDDIRDQKNVPARLNIQLIAENDLNFF